jgi:hypothetical protein
MLAQSYVDRQRQWDRQRLCCAGLRWARRFINVFAELLQDEAWRWVPTEGSRRIVVDRVVHAIGGAPNEVYHDECLCL